MGSNRLLRHAVVSLAYRTRKALHGAPDGFADFEAGSGVRTPHSLVNHMTNLLWLTVAALRGHQRAPLSELEDFRGEVRRFSEAASELTGVLSEAEFNTPELDERLLQGPISDAITHAGQLALLRRLAGAPIPAEDFFAATVDADVEFKEFGLDSA